jgi:hypothetical protein
VQEQRDLINAGRRNLIINGDMRISQRGTSATISDGSNEGYRTLDRWRVLFSSSAGGTATMSQDTTVPNNSFTNSLKIDVTTADTSVGSSHAITLQNRLEAQDIANSGWDYTASNSYLTVSFWARSTKAGTYCVFFHTPDGTSKSLVREYALAANTWKYITLKFKGDSGISFDNNNGHGLTVGWALVAGSNRYENTVENTWIESSSGQGQSRYATSNQVNFFDSTSNDFYLTGVQLELGSVATEFDNSLSYGEQLALCQRYYQVVNFSSYGPMDGYYGAGNYLHWCSQRPVKMRANPTSTITYGTVLNLSDNPYIHPGDNEENAWVSARASNTGRSYAILTKYTADAEL